MKDETQLYYELSEILEKYKDVYLGFNKDLIELYNTIKLEVIDYTNTK
jgi:hypothetical protein